jgi:hypothetical protein
MPYPLDFPSSVWPERVVVRPRWANATFDNPITLQPQVQRLQAHRFDIDIKMQLMPAELAGEFAAFIYALQGSYGTFNFDLTPWCPGISPPPGQRVFRLATNDHGWDGELARSFNFTFSALEVIGS